MSTTFSQHQANVLEVFKRDDKTTQLKLALNETLKEMVACVDPRRQQDIIYKATVAGREEYPIPTTILRLNHPVKIIEGDTNNAASSYPMDFITPGEYDSLEPHPNAGTVQTGKPYAYTMKKNSILLTRIPDKVYRIEFLMGGEALPLVEDGDETIFSGTWDEVLKAGTLSRLYRGIGLTAEADEWQAIYRFGNVGNIGGIVGGLELLKKLNRLIMDAPLVVEPNDF